MPSEIFAFVVSPAPACTKFYDLRVRKPRVIYEKYFEWDESFQEPISPYIQGCLIAGQMYRITGHTYTCAHTCTQANTLYMHTFPVSFWFLQSSFWEEDSKEIVRAFHPKMLYPPMHCQADGGPFRKSSSRNRKPKDITWPLDGLMLPPVITRTVDASSSSTGPAHVCLCLLDNLYNVCPFRWPQE